jgi:TatD DNase family protein
VEQLVDTHCHLLSGLLAPDAEGAWARARAAGVSRMVLVGIDAANSEAAQRFAASHDGVYATAGIHPNDTAAATGEDQARVEALLGQDRVVALGETGLDFYRKTSPPARQEELLEWHAELGLRHRLPLVLHIRDAFARVEEVLRPHAARGLQVVLHCFNGGPRELRPFLAWDAFVSFSGVLTYPTAGEVRGAASLCPRDRLLVETDAPWLAPVPHRGRRNEPAFVRHTAEHLALVRGESPSEVALATTSNAIRAFGLDASAS